MLLRITASAFNDRGPLFTEQALAAIHQGMRSGDSITLSLLREGGTVCAACDVPAGLRQFVTTQLLAQYPSTRIERIAERSADHASWSAELTLRPGIFPLKRHPQFADQATQSAADPLSGILSSLAGGERDPLSPRVDLVLRPASHRGVRSAQRVLRNLVRPRLAGDHRRRERYLRYALSDRWYLRPWRGVLPAPRAACREGNGIRRPRVARMIARRRFSPRTISFAIGSSRCDCDYRFGLRSNTKRERWPSSRNSPGRSVHSPSRTRPHGTSFRSKEGINGDEDGVFCCRLKNWRRFGTCRCSRSRCRH